LSLPTGVDYLKTIQSPATALADPNLRLCTVDRNPMGQPMSWAGSNAIVFRLRGVDGRPFALRCFTQNIPDVEARYRAYSEFYGKAPLGLKSALVGIRYLPKGIQVPDGSPDPWKPTIVMTWVEGNHLGAWVEANRANTFQLKWLQGKLKGLEEQMASARFVHGDLQHRNILVSEHGPVLIDYDSVILPGAKNLTLTTQGLAAFRHPRATKTTPPAAIDRFAFLVLHVGLEALIRQPRLFDQWGKVEGLLFQGADFRNCTTSPLFQSMLAHPDLRGMAGALVQVCQADPGSAPDLASFLSSVAMVPGTAPSHSALPPWNAQLLKIMEQLYSPKPDALVNVHRVEVEGPYRFPVCLPSSRTIPHAAMGATETPLGNAVQSFCRGNARTKWVGSMLVSLLLVVGLGFLLPSLITQPEDVATIRKDLQLSLEGKKDRLMLLIVGLDEDLETAHNLPESLRLATLDASSGDVKAQSVAKLRWELAQTRVQARQALVRCDGVLEDFDNTLRDPSFTSSERVDRLAAIQDLPPDFSSRIPRELHRKGLP